MLIGPGRQYRRALEQQEGHGDVIGQQGKAFDAGAGAGQQGVQCTVNIPGELDLIRVNFNGLDLLALQRVQAFIRHE
ncbi:hypothetical protein D3C71_2142290 [compost metagenome]